MTSTAFANEFDMRTGKKGYGFQSVRLFMDQETCTMQNARSKDYFQAQRMLSGKSYLILEKMQTYLCNGYIAFTKNRGNSFSAAHSSCLTFMTNMQSFPTHGSLILLDLAIFSNHDFCTTTPATGSTGLIGFILYRGSWNDDRAP